MDGWLTWLNAPEYWLARLLVERDPGPDQAPALIRAGLYRYRFTTPQERGQTGAWRVRYRIGEYLPPIGLRRFEARR